MRILVSEDLRPARNSELADLVDRVVRSFLETRWVWPRRFDALTPFTFLLTDPRVAEIDVVELQGLSHDLHVKLFGSEGQGKVVLLAFEGERSEVLRFAEATPLELRSVLAGAPQPAFFGKISLIAPGGVEPVAHAGAQATVAQSAALSPGPAADCRFSGVYFIPRQTFIGTVLTTREGRGRQFVDIFDGGREFTEAEALDFDLRCLDAAPTALAGFNAGALYVSLAFTSVMHGAARRACEPKIATLSRQDRTRLAATLRGVPRDPSPSALAQIREVLAPAFSVIDLRVTDPYFEVGRLANEAVSSVTLVLPHADESARAAAMRRFMAAREGYRAKRIWPAVTDVRTRPELALCAKLHVPFVSGRAICGFAADPIPPRPLALSKLPYRIEAAA